jgi:hypothetical protein
VRAPYKIGTVQCDVNKPFIFNGEFTLHKKSNRDWFLNNEISFPPGLEKPDGSYRTHFGPALSHNARIYSNTNHNLRLAMRRLTGVRLPETPGAHDTLRAAQRVFIKNHYKIIHQLRDMYTPFFKEYSSSEVEMYLHYADPHQKRALRIQAHDELLETGRSADPDDIWLWSVWWKLKCREWARPGKYPRAICDLGVAASLRGFVLTSVLKKAQDETEIDFNGGTAVFCKSPDPHQMAKHFRLLHNPPGKFYFVYFSDDSCLAIRQNDGTVKWYNLDISSCDASHTELLFSALLDLVPPGQARHDMELLIKQCSAPLKIVSRVNKKHKIKLIPKSPKLYSGSTLTTAINNLANLLIALAITSSYDPLSVHDKDGQNLSMVAAAARVGYILTGCNPLEHFEDVQFLKHSPIFDVNGDIHAMLNLGVLLRASGTCEGDLPGRGDIAPRARAFQRGLLLGAYPHASFEILETMRSAMGLGPIVMSNAFEWKVVTPDEPYPNFHVPAINIMRRYRLNQAEYDSILDFARCDVGYFYSSPGATKILEKDYGLETIEHEDIEYVCFQSAEAHLPILAG